MQQVLILLLALLPVPAFIKSMYIDNYILGFSGANGTENYQSLIHDIPVFAIIYLVFTLALYNQIGSAIRFLLRFIGFFIFALYLTDMYLMHSFFQHLTIHDTIKYIGYVPQYLTQILQFSFPLLIGVILAIAIFIVLVVVTVKGISGKTVVSIAGILALACLVNSFFISDNYVHSWFYKNLYEYNRMILTESKPYSQNFKQTFQYDEPMVCKESTPQHPDIIILMVESLSSYQSNLFSGINNWTPQLDSIASKNMHFTHFVANGFTTEDGEIALLKGMIPLTPPSTFTEGGGTVFSGFYGYDNSLPVFLKNQGYSTSFLTSSDLKFSNTGNWAKSIGFDYTEGANHPFYDNWPRFQFDAAPDDALYLRIIQHMDEKNPKQPRFIFVKTATTHHPFINPESGKNSEEETFKYADQALGRFYKNLEKRGFFKNGLLLIVGDHHSMVPLRKEEIDKFGTLDAQSKIPLIIASQNRVQAVTERYQQIDIHNGLKSLTQGLSCTSEWLGDVWQLTPPQHIIHRRGDNRTAVTVYSTKHGTNEVFLNGDNTRMNNESPDTKKIVDKINHLRMEKNSAHLPAIAHAGGILGNLVYSNAYEAMNNSVKNGFTLIELDFSWTSDGQLVCLHDWEHTFQNLYGKKLSQPLSLEEFKSLKPSSGNWKACTAMDLQNWLERNPEVRIVTDIKNNNVQGLAEISRLISHHKERIIPQIYDIDELSAVKKLGFENIIFTLYLSPQSDLEITNLVDKEKFYAITMPLERVTSGLAMILKKQGHIIYTHTINDENIRSMLNNYYSVSGIYTDQLLP